MKERSDLTDPSNGPLEFAITRGCIGFQITKMNSAGIYFLFQASLDLVRGEQSCTWSSLYEEYDRI